MAKVQSDGQGYCEEDSLEYNVFSNKGNNKPSKKKCSSNKESKRRKAQRALKRSFE